MSAAGSAGRAGASPITDEEFTCDARALDNARPGTYMKIVPILPDSATRDRQFQSSSRSGVQAMTIDDRPTIAAPDDDPYLWLEDIEGERALDFVDQQSRRTLETFGNRNLRATATRWLRSTTGPTTFPMSRAAAGCSTISGRMPKIRAACGGERRWPSFARPSPHGKPCWISTSLAAEENEDWLLNWTTAAAGKLPRDRRACRAAAATP